MNVHVFDGKIDINYKKSLIKGRISVDDKVKLFRLLFSRVNDRAKPYLQMIADNIQGHANYEVGNDLYADDILAEICLFLEKSDNDGSIFKTLEEQLAEISGGTCPSGRTTRLWQIYVAIRDEEKKEKKEKKEEGKKAVKERKSTIFVNSRGEEVDIDGIFGC